MFLELDQVDSTNAELKRRLEVDEAGLGSVVLAATQSAGKGRYGRHWHSPLGNLYFSLVLDEKEILPDNSGVSEWTRYALLSGAVASTVVSWYLDDPYRVSYKWPNDILIDGRKVAGLLLESVVTPTRRYLIAGVGLNIVSAPSDKETNFKSTFLQRHTKLSVRPLSLVSRFMSEYDVWWQFWQRKGFRVLLDELEEIMWLRDEKIAIKLSSGTVLEGLCRGFDDEGKLRLEESPSRVHVLSMGDVCAL